MIQTVYTCVCFLFLMNVAFSLDLREDMHWRDHSQEGSYLRNHYQKQMRTDLVFASMHLSKDILEKIATEELLAEKKVQSIVMQSCIIPKDVVLKDYLKTATQAKISFFPVSCRANDSQRNGYCSQYQEFQKEPFSLKPFQGINNLIIKSPNNPIDLLIDEAIAAGIKFDRLVLDGQFISVDLYKLSQLTKTLSLFGPDILSSGRIQTLDEGCKELDLSVYGIKGEVDLTNLSRGLSLIHFGDAIDTIKGLDNPNLSDITFSFEDVCLVRSLKMPLNHITKIKVERIAQVRKQLDLVPIFPQLQALHLSGKVDNIAPLKASSLTSLSLASGMFPSLDWVIDNVNSNPVSELKLNFSYEGPKIVEIINQCKNLQTIVLYIRCFDSQSHKGMIETALRKNGYSFIVMEYDRYGNPNSYVFSRKALEILDKNTDVLKDVNIYCLIC